MMLLFISFSCTRTDVMGLEPGVQYTDLLLCVSKVIERERSRGFELIQILFKMF